MDQLKKDIEFISAGMDVPVQGRNRIMEQVIDHYLILEYGRVNRIFVSQHETEQMMKEIKNGYTEKAFSDALLRGYVDPDRWTDKVKEQILVNKILKEITENTPPPGYKDIKRYYDENQDEFRTPEMLEFRQIVTGTREDAEVVLKRLTKGEDMHELAKKFSIAPEAEKGGRVGWLARENLEKSMERALFSTPRGKISPIVKTPYGYHIFEVLSVRKKGRKQLPEVIREIESKLIDQRRKIFCRKWLKLLRSHFEIKVNQDLLDRMEKS
jgi:parvulin-like peptidyl-prolyl isomerase